MPLSSTRKCLNHPSSLSRCRTTVNWKEKNIIPQHVSFKVATLRVFLCLAVHMNVFRAFQSTFALSPNPTPVFRYHTSSICWTKCLMWMETSFPGSFLGNTTTTKSTVSIEEVYIVPWDNVSSGSGSAENFQIRAERGLSRTAKEVWWQKQESNKSLLHSLHSIIILEHYRSHPSCNIFPPSKLLWVDYNFRGPPP